MNGTRRSVVSLFTRYALVTLGVFGLGLRVHATVIFSANFEDGSGGYSADGFTYTTDTATSNLWHATTHRSVSPTHCQYYGIEGVYNYDTGAQNAGNLVSPMISLVGVTPPITLSFNYLLQTEGFPGFDVASVQISAPGTGGWVTLATLPDSASFTNATVDLSAYFGLPCFIRFKFDTIDGVNNGFEGWYIDDITITGTGGTNQTNSWALASSGKWETGANWSAGTPSSADPVDLITNATTKTVTIDPTTTLSNSLNQCLSINNLTISGPAGTANTLQLANPGAFIPLNISSALTMDGGGAVLVTNFGLQVGGLASVGVTGSGTMSLQSGAVTISSNLVLGTSAGATGTLWVTGGTLSLTNLPNTLIVGISGDGQVVVSNGTLNTRGLFIGTNQFSRGTITVAGGTLIASNVFIGIASNSFGAIWVNSGQFIATNRSEIIGSFGSAQLTVSNAGTFLGTTMFVANRSPSAGTLTVAGGFANIYTLIMGGSNTTGSAWITGGGTLVSTNGGINIAALQCAYQMTISNSTVLTRDMSVGGGLNSVGTLSVQGGTLSFSSAVTSNCLVAASQGSKGFVWINGGTVTATNNGCILYLGLSGPGQWVLTNGSTTVGNLFCGTLSSGTITISGGTFSVLSNSIVALDGPNLTGTISVVNGQLIATNGDFVLGCFGYAPLTVSSGGSVLLRSMIISSNAPSKGVLTIPAGQVTVFDRIVVGDCVSNALGQITVNGGQLYVTNATHTGYLDVRGGTVTVSGTGRLVVDKLVMTNACGLFVRNGGTLSITTMVLDPNLSAVGDGIPNGWKQQYGLDPLDSNLATKDADSDGLNNLQEFLAGTDPTNPASVFRITSIARVSTNILVTWSMGSGRTNALQRTVGGVGGSFNTNNFTTIFTVTNTVGTVTNYVDVNAATNFPALYYRVRLVP